MNSLKVFVSATSRDLSVCREVARRALLTHDIQPVDQEHFPPDERSLTDYLEATVGRCDAIICLVGHVFGAAPRDQQQPRSYTQLEYDYARRTKKPVFVFMASEQMRLSDAQPETPEQERLQQEHRERLQDLHKCEFFENPSRLELRLSYAAPRIRSKCGRVPLYFRHLPPAPAWFEGREEERSQLRNALEQPTPSIIAVVGIGGQGKTSLAHRVLRDRVDIAMDSGFWCTAHSTGYTFEMFLDDALEHLTHGVFDKQAKPSPLERVSELLRVMQTHRVLLVIDGLEEWLRGGNEKADRTSLLGSRRGQTEELDQFLEQASGLGAGSHLMITTRVMPAALDQVEFATVPVRDLSQRQLGLVGLDPDASAALMKKMGVRGDSTQLKQMAERFAFHPLALKVVSSYVVEEYAGHLTELESLDDLTPEGSLANLFDQVEASLPANAESTRLLQVIAHSQDAPTIAVLRDVLDGGGPLGLNVKTNLRRLLSSLMRYQLLSVDVDSDTVSVHPLVREHFASKVDKEDAEQIHDRFRAHYESLPITERPITLEDVRPRRLAVEHAILSNSADQCARILFSTLNAEPTFFRWLNAQGHFTEGAAILRRAADIDGETQRFRFLIPRSVLCLGVGRVKEAIEDLDDAIDILENGRNRPTTERSAELAGALMNRGDANRLMFQYDLALRDFDRSISIFGQLAKQENRFSFYLASAMMDRGLVLREIGNQRSALCEHRAAVDIFGIWALADQNKVMPELAMAFCNRGNALADLRELDAAIEDYAKARDIFQSLIDLGRSEFAGSVARMLILLAFARQKKQLHRQALLEVDEAIHLLRRLVDEKKRQFEPTLAFGWMTRAISRVAMGQRDSALHNAQRARELYVRLAEEGRTDLSGQLVHARLVEAFCLYATDRVDVRKWSMRELSERQRRCLHRTCE